MVRPHFIKITPSAKAHSVISKGVASKNAVLPSNNDKPCVQKQVRAYSPMQTRRCEPAKEKFQVGCSSKFLDIDGNEPISLDEPDDLGPKDTSHKIKRHLSLYDLTQQSRFDNGKKPPIAGNSCSISECSQLRNVDRPKSTANKCALPKGSQQMDQPYVVPKFMPSFREIMMESRKEDPMISLTESTPPSLQKWAVEWNSEPKSLSISELKEDILREAEEKNARREGRYNEAKSSIEARILDDGTSRAHEGRQSKTEPKYSEPLNSPRGVVYKPPDFPSALNEKSTLDWLPEKYNKLKRISKGFKKGYSFAEAISRKDSNPSINSYSDSVPRIFKQRSHVYDEEEQEFYEWFKDKLSKASESSVQSKEKSSSVMSNSGYQGPGVPSETKNAAFFQYETNIDPLAKCIPEIQKQPERQAPRRQISSSEKSSSFYQWLSSRICVPVDRSSWHEKPKPRTVDETGDLKTPVYPWSRSYASKSSNATDQELNKKADFIHAFLNKPNSANETALYRKVKSHMTFRKPKLARVRKAKSLVGIRPVTARKSNHKDVKTGDRQPAPERKSVPYSQWIVNSEADHVQNVRSLESQEVPVKMLTNHGTSQQPGSFLLLKHSDPIADNKPTAGFPWSAEDSTNEHSKLPSSNFSSTVTNKVSPSDVIDSAKYFSISDDAPITDGDLLGSHKFRDDTHYKAAEDDAQEECENEIDESPDRMSETANTLWSVSNHQPREISFPSDDSLDHDRDLDEPKVDDDKLKFESYLQHDEEATDADWNRTVGPKSIWPSDDDLIKRLGGEATKIDLFALRSHTRPL